MIDFANNILVSLSEYGRDYIESGFFLYEDWSKKMNNIINNYNDILSLSEEDIDNIINVIWESPVKGLPEYKSMKQYADAINPETQLSQVRNSIDKLFRNIEAYRKSDFFINMLHFCATFKELAPYNAMLVMTQMPSARYVLTANQWLDKYQRKPKFNARPLVTLRKYGPIDFVFEIGDTESVASGNLFEWSDQEILNQLANPYATSGYLSNELYDILLSHLSYYGIRLDYFRVASTFGAEIRKHDCKINVDGVEAAGYYIISVNERADRSTAFASICHELGHLFCHHLISPNSKDPWWTLRNLSWEEEEFEAEIVSYVICERFGVVNKSWTYLSGVLGKNGSIPNNISIDRIFKAANEVERMLKKDLNITSCMLYIKDSKFKKEWNKFHVDEEK